MVSGAFSIIKKYIMCKHISFKKCGYIITVKGISGAIWYRKVPEKKCKYEVKAKDNH